MTENKRFTLNHIINKQYISADIYDNGTFIASIGIGGELIVELLNSLNDENEELKIKNQKQENLINSQNNFIEETENWFEKWGFDVVNYRILDQIMEHFLEGDWER